MKITLVLKDCIYDCKIRITDSRGERDYYISSSHAQENQNPSIAVDVFDSDFSLLLIPVMADTQPLLNEIQGNNWKSKLALKGMNFVINSFEKGFLRVGCNYRIEGLQDGDRLDITLQNYVFGTFDRFDLLDLFPVVYSFFEVSNFNRYYTLTDAYETNRNDLLKFTKKFSLADFLGNGFLLALFTYPIKVGRVKRLTKNKKIYKTLAKFNNFSVEERQKFLEKQEKFF